MTSLFSILYVDWFIFPMLVYISAGLTLWLSYQIDPKRTKRIIPVWIVISFIGYAAFLLAPVPQDRLDSFFNQVATLKQENEEFDINMLRYTANEPCKKDYISGFNYFRLNKAVKKDLSYYMDKKSVATIAVLDKEKTNGSFKDFCKFIYKD